MAEEVGDTGGGIRDGLRKGAASVRQEASRERIEGRIDEAVNERPLARYLLDMGIVVRALAIAVVACVVVWLLLSAKIAALVLVVGFFGAWLGLASSRYNRRKPTKPADAD
jgi:Flp pilus assembly protein TadB